MTGPSLPKPRHGAPCNRCGRCCAAEICPLGEHVFGRWEGPCPALTFSDGRSSCGLVERPRDFAPTRVALHGSTKLGNAAWFLVGADFGCDAQTTDEPADEAFRARLIASRRAARGAASDARRLWGVTS